MGIINTHEFINFNTTYSLTNMTSKNQTRPMYKKKAKSKTVKASKKSRRSLKSRFRNMKRLKGKDGLGRKRAGNMANFSDYSSSGDETLEGYNCDNSTCHSPHQHAHDC